MKIIYMGTPEFSCPPLESLHRSRHHVTVVVTGPDERSPRGGQTDPTPVRALSERLGLPVLTAVSVKDDRLVETLRGYSADLIVVVAFKVLPAKLFTLPPLGSINIHASLLPKYRGAAPINWALINGDPETGLTSFFLKRKVDTGDIILQQKVPISDEDTFDTLSQRMSDMAGPFLLQTLRLIERGEVVRCPQADSSATPAPKIHPFDAMIDFGLPAERVRNFVRGLSSQPGAYTYFRGKRVKILSCRLPAGDTGTAGSTVAVGAIVPDRKRLLVQCAGSLVEIEKLLPEGKKPIDGVSFVNGFKPQPGERFGELPERGEQQV